MINVLCSDITTLMSCYKRINIPFHPPPPWLPRMSVVDRGWDYGCAAVWMM